MTTQSPDQTAQTALHLTINDITEARDSQPTTLHMRWPVDRDTTRRLEQLTYERVPIRRRLQRWLAHRVTRQNK